MANAKPYRAVKTSDRFYRIWSGMKSRIHNPNSTWYEYYGGRGITLSKEWLDFDNFYNDMYSSYQSNLSLERIDNTKGYSKDNCRWATQKEQSNNTRRNRTITIGKETKNLCQWIEESGLKGSTVRQRYYVYGWSIEKALGMEVSVG